MADVYMIAVSDKAVSELSKQLPFENRLVVHTSGSVALKLLDMKHRRGVFYPLQTFSATSELDFSEVPFCIETMEKEDAKLLKNPCNFNGKSVLYDQYRTTASAAFIGRICQ